MDKKPLSYRELKAIWYQKLKESGFDDIEYDSGSLKDLDRRTKRFDAREDIGQFYSALDTYLHKEGKNLRDLDYQILTLYSEGVQVTRIAQLLDRGRTTIKDIIKKFTLLIKEQVEVDLEED